MRIDEISKALDGIETKLCEMQRNADINEFADDCEYADFRNAVASAITQVRIAAQAAQ